MALTFPRDLVTEIYLAGLGWVDISTDVRQTSPVVWTRGAANEQGLVAPSTFNGVLKNASGKYTLDNPMSPYYGKLSRNTPIRQSLRVSRDTFDGRTVSNGWGTTGVGTAKVTSDAWSNTNATDYAVSAGKGSQSIGASGSFTYAWLGGLHLRDAWVRDTFTVPFADVTGAQIEPGTLLLRYLDANNYYMVRPIITTTEQIQLTAICRVGGVEFTLGTVITPILHTGQTMVVVAQIEAETIRAKLFQGTDVEPFEWGLTVHNDYIPYYGAAGVRFGVAGGNTNAKPIAISNDDWEVRDVRFCGELAEVNPRWTENHREVLKIAEVRGAGITARLSLPSVAPLRSAPYQYVTSSNPAPTHYWPLDEPSTATFGSPAIGSSSAKAVLTTSQDKNKCWGQGKLAPWLPNGVSLGIERYAGSFVLADYDLYAYVDTTVGTRWSFDFVRAGGLDTGNRVVITTSLDTWEVGFFVTVSQFQVLRNGGSLGVSNSFAYDAAWDGFAHHVRLNVVENGANVDWSLEIDGQVFTNLSGTVAGVAAGNVSKWSFTDKSTLDAPVSIGHVALYVDVVPPSSANAARAVAGWVGERAGRRAERLCLEKGVAFDWVGQGNTLDDTQSMGPQRPLPFLKLMEECAATDGGVLYEPRSVAGLALRTSKSLEAQIARTTLSYSGKDVAAPLLPAYDDSRTVNDVMVQRTLGASLRVEQAAGALNVAEPGTGADAAGRHPKKYELNLRSDLDLAHAAGWLLHLGTVAETRYPKIRINLRALASATKIAEVLGLNVADRFVIQSLTAADVFKDLDQAVRGYTETLRDATQHDIVFNTAPNEPYRVVIWDDGVSRWGSGGVTTFDSSLTTTAIGARNVTVVSGSRWTTDAADFPLDVECEGERITLSGITGAGAAQVMTISARSGNGAVKAHAAGAAIRLWQDYYFGRSPT